MGCSPLTKPKQEARSCISQLHKTAWGFVLTKGTVPHIDVVNKRENRQEGRRGINKTAGNVWKFMNLALHLSGMFLSSVWEYMSEAAHAHIINKFQILIGVLFGAKSTFSIHKLHYSIFLNHSPFQIENDVFHVIALFSLPNDDEMMMLFMSRCQNIALLMSKKKRLCLIFDFDIVERMPRSMIGFHPPLDD